LLLGLTMQALESLKSLQGQAAPGRRLPEIELDRAGRSGRAVSRVRLPLEVLAAQADGQGGILAIARSGHGIDRVRIPGIGLEQVGIAMIGGVEAGQQGFFVDSGDDSGPIHPVGIDRELDAAGRRMKDCLGCHAALKLRDCIDLLQYPDTVDRRK
jgi:hypothetical protein